MSSEQKCDCSNLYNKSIRNSNVEILRIVSMFLILMSHCDNIFGLDQLYAYNSLGVKAIITDWLDMGGQIGVACFILISGYYMTERTITKTKLLKLAGEVWWYCIIFFIVNLLLCIYSKKPLSTCLSNIKVSLFPITFCHYWFVTAYVILMIISPYINKLISLLSQAEYKRLLVILIIIFVAIHGGIPHTLLIVECPFIPVIIYYFIAGYIKRFGLKKYNKNISYLIVITSYVVLLCSYYCITFVGVKIKKESILQLRHFFGELFSPLILIISVTLFVISIQTNIKNSKVINEIAGCTFGVYLIHNNVFVKEWEKEIFPIYKEESSINVFIYVVISIVIIYVACTIIDFLRKMTVEKLWTKFISIIIKN